MSRDVTIRRASAADAACLYRIRSEPSASRYQPLQRHPPERLATILAAREDAPLDGTLDSKVQWVIECDGISAGWVSLEVTSREHDIASVGYSVSEAYRGQGAATAALRQVVAIAFDPAGIGLERLEAVAAVENVASRRVLVKTGFREEGIAEKLLVIDGVRVDHVRFGLVRSLADPVSDGHGPGR